MVTIIINDSAAVNSMAALPYVQRAALRSAAREVYDFLRDYHSKMTWRGERWIPGANSGQFAASVVQGWQQPVIFGLNITITNTFGLLSWKVTGGTISPRNAQFLTIPLVSEAKGMPARSIPGLFVAGSALCRRVGKRLEAVYALSRSVTQAPWPGALPEDEAVEEVFSKAFTEFRLFA